jgi:hypothetical protein
MKKLPFILFFMAFGLFMQSYAAEPVKLQSPEGQLEVKFEVRDGVSYYSLDRAGKPIVLPSKMDFTIEWRETLLMLSC